MPLGLGTAFTCYSPRVNPRPLPDDLGRLVRNELARLDVPGAAVGVIAGGEWYAEGFGVTHLDHPLPVTPDTIFQTGSTSKTFTATALLLLAVAGRLDIEAPVRTYLPGFRLQSEADAARVTVKDLLTHHGGWVGDYFRDFGRGDDALALMTASMAGAPQVIECGRAFSYSNAGFNVLARIVEVVSGESFEAFVTERLLLPLEMTRSMYWADEAILHRVAVGHLSEAGRTFPSPRMAISRNMAGSSGVMSSVVDQLRWAAFQLGDGDGILPAAALRKMQTPHRDGGSVCAKIGLSWEIDYAESGEAIVKHGGAINGQLSAFEFVPSAGYACTVLTNAESGREAKTRVSAACLERFAGLRRPLPAANPALAASAPDYAGLYLQRIFELRIEARDGQLIIHESTPERYRRGIQAEPPPPMRAALFAPDRAVVLDPPHAGETCEFLRDPNGAIALMRWDGRLSRRVAP